MNSICNHQCCSLNSFPINPQTEHPSWHWPSCVLERSALLVLALTAWPVPLAGRKDWLRKSCSGMFMYSQKPIRQCHCLDWVWSCDANMHALFMCVLGKNPSVATCAKRPNCLSISAMPTLGYDKSQRIQLRCPNSQLNVGHIGHWHETCRTSSSKQHKSHAHNVSCAGTK